MLLVGFFAVALFLVILVGDWLFFTGLSPSACRYGCGIARDEDQLPMGSRALALHRFDAAGMMTLPHGIARLFPDENRILLRPQYRLWSLRFRTAWPIKGTIEVREDGEATRLTCVKRIPWSSAIMTALWFAIVGLGTVGFLVAYTVEGGLASLSSLLIGLGITGVGVLVFLFGLIIVALAYRLENDRLGQAYRELREVLTGRH